MYMKSILLFKNKVSLEKIWGFPGGSVVKNPFAKAQGKEPSCQCRRYGFSPWVRKNPWRKKWQPTSVFLLGKSHGQRSLAGYIPWGHKRVGHNLVDQTTTERIYSLENT